jgi:hypothetical protein
LFGRHASQSAAKEREEAATMSREAARAKRRMGDGSRKVTRRFSPSGGRRASEK